jgi:hypothetical protein
MHVRARMHASCMHVCMGVCMCMWGMRMQFGKAKRCEETVSICVSTHAWMCACLPVCMYVCVHVCMRARVHVGMHVCMCACMYVLQARMYAPVHACMWGEGKKKEWLLRDADGRMT